MGSKKNGVEHLLRKMRTATRAAMRRRDKQILRCFESGETLASIGERHGFTRQHAHRIVLRARAAREDTR